MKKSQLAAQFYTLRDFLKTPADIAGSFEKVRKIGYEAVQLSGLGPIDTKELAKMAKDYGLKICATHEGGGDIVCNTDQVIEKLKMLDCKYTAYPWPAYFPKTRNGAVQYARDINAAAEKMAAAGLGLCYHNHALEFQRFDGELWLDIIYREAPALQAELDTFWVQSGGQDPETWIRKFPNRQPLLHLKEYGVKDNDRIMLPIGSGNLDWKGIIKAGEDCGVEYFIVEQDNCNGICPFDALKSSFDYISSNFFD